VQPVPFAPALTQRHKRDSSESLIDKFLCEPSHASRCTRPRSLPRRCRAQQLPAGGGPSRHHPDGAQPPHEEVRGPPRDQAVHAHHPAGFAHPGGARPAAQGARAARGGTGDLRRSRRTGERAPGADCDRLPADHGDPFPAARSCRFRRGSPRHRRAHLRQLGKRDRRARSEGRGRVRHHHPFIQPLGPRDQAVDQGALCAHLPGRSPVRQGPCRALAGARRPPADPHQCADGQSHPHRRRAGQQPRTNGMALRSAARGKRGVAGGGGRCHDHRAAGGHRRLPGDQSGRRPAPQPEHHAHAWSRDTAWRAPDPACPRSPRSHRGPPEAGPALSGGLDCSGRDG
jgi:hypothetical protein